jgi:hypothetical protein
MSENNRSDSQEWRVDYLMLAALWGSSFLFMRTGADSDFLNFHICFNLWRFILE